MNMHPHLPTAASDREERDGRRPPAADAAGRVRAHWLPHKTTVNHADRLLHFSIASTVVDCRCPECVRTRVILTFPAKVMAATGNGSGFPDEVINAITSATIEILADLEIAEGREDIPF